MVEIIAEVAQGYEGVPMLTELLTKGAIRTDADAIKFQTHIASEESSDKERNLHTT